MNALSEDISPEYLSQLIQCDLDEASVILHFKVTTHTQAGADLDHIESEFAL